MLANWILCHCNASLLYILCLINFCCQILFHIRTFSMRNVQHELKSSYIYNGLLVLLSIRLNKSPVHSAQVSSYQEDVLLLDKLSSKSSFLTNCPPFVLHFVNLYDYFYKTYSCTRVDILLLSRWMLNAALVPAVPIALLQLMMSQPADSYSYL